MDKYYITTKLNERWCGDRINSVCHPEVTGSLLCGFGQFRGVFDDIEMVDNVTYTRIMYRNKKRSIHLSGLLRLNPDGTIDEVSVYMSGDAVVSHCKDDDGTVWIAGTIDSLYQSKGATSVNKLFLSYLEKNYPDLLKYESFVGDLYNRLYRYYKKHVGEKIFLTDFFEAFVSGVMMKHIYINDVRAYFPRRLNRKMFNFIGGVKHFDNVVVTIPLSNPTRGCTKLVSVVKKFKKEVFTNIYDKLEEYSGIPKEYFKMDRCIVTKDECLECIISIKEVDKKEAE